MFKNTTVSNICKTFADVSMASLKFSKTPLSKMIKLGRILPLLFIFPAFKIGGMVVKRKTIAIAKDAAKNAAKQKNKKADFFLCY